MTPSARYYIVLVVSGQDEGQKKSETVVSVPMPRSLREKVRAQAAAEGRSLAGHLRWLAEQDVKEAA